MRRLLGIGFALALTASAAPAVIVEVVRGGAEIAIPEGIPMGEEVPLTEVISLEGEKLEFSYRLEVHGAEDRFSKRWLVIDLRNQYRVGERHQIRIDLDFFESDGGLVYSWSYSDASGDSSPHLELHTLEPEDRIEFSSVRSYEIAVTVRSFP